MKRIYILTTMLALTWASHAQQREKRDLNGFTELNITGVPTIVLKQSDTYSVEVEADNGNTSEVKTILNGKLLEISTPGSSGKEDPKVYISAPTIELMRISGTVEVETDGVLAGEELTIHTSGASEVEMTLKMNALRVHSSGASNLELIGYAGDLDISASGASNIDADDLVSLNAKVTLSGASNTEVNVSESIDGSVSGVANLSIDGNPKSENITRSGMSTIDGKNQSYNGYREDVEITNDVIGDVIVQESGDTTRIMVGKRKILIVEGDDKTKVDLDLKDSSENEAWQYGIDGLILGVNGFLNSANELKTPSTHPYLELDMARSINVQLNLWDAEIGLVKEYVTLHPGLGFEFNSYEFRKNYWIEQSSDNNTEISAVPALLPDSSTLDFQKNRLKDTYLNVPLMLAFHTHKDHKKAFHLGMGGYAGLRLTSKMKYKYRIDGEGDKLKRKDDYYLSPFRYGLMASVGYGKVNVFANYALNGLFEEGKGPEMHPFSVGVMLIGF